MTSTGEFPKSLFDDILLTWNCAESARKSLFSKRSSVDNDNRWSSSLTTANLNLFQRPLSALARHRIRDLSDIREVSSSSKGGTVSKKASGPVDGADDGKTPIPPTQPNGALEETSSDDNGPASKYVTPPGGLGSRATSARSLPLRDVPERRSSASVLGHDAAASRQSSMQDFPSWKLPPPSAAGQVIPSRGRASSPVRRALRRDAVSSEALRSTSSKTFIRTAPPLDILDVGNSRHGRVDMSLRLPAPLFVGGGTVEGQISLTIDGGTIRKNKPKPILISKLSVDIIGVEEVSDGRRWIFLSLATELFDEQHPPPASLVTTQTPVSQSELFWTLKPSIVVLPFCLNLPLNLGPPPYLSKQAGIRYMLCPTAVIKSGGKQSIVRSTWNIQMLTVHDPEKALASLPSPLLASDSLSLSNGPETNNVKLTAGLHRQTWVNGAMIFVDIHVCNNNSKTIKKIEIQLEKTTLWYSHAAAGTAEKSASHLRLPKRSDNELVSSSVVKKSGAWKGILPNSSEVRTCDINVPRSHVTISTGRYFEVRYFLNVIVSVTMFKTVAVQLPVTIIHINSIDVLPNSLGQVAAAIEAKRAKTVPINDDGPLYPPYHQGQAFAAPRRQSLDRMKNSPDSFGAEDLNALTRELDESPRRFRRTNLESHKRKSTMSTVLSDENIHPGRPSGVPSSHHHHTRHGSCYHCQIACIDHVRKQSSVASLTGPKLPRLRLSTSGLGFSDSEFEVPPDSPLARSCSARTKEK